MDAKDRRPVQLWAASRRWKTNRFWPMKNWCLGWDPKKNAEFPPAFHPPGKVSHWNSENSIFFSFPFLSNIRGVVLGALHVSDSMPKGAEDPGIQTDQNCYVLLGSSGFIYKSLKTIIRPLVPSRKHSQENARIKKKHLKISEPNLPARGVN